MSQNMYLWVSKPGVGLKIENHGFVKIFKQMRAPFPKITKQMANYTDIFVIFVCHKENS